MRISDGSSDVCSSDLFTALALALPHLPEHDLIRVGGGKAVQGCPMGVLGPGTGLGVSALIPDRAQRWLALAGEGGHTSFAPTDDRELILWQAARRRYEHVSMERLLSGSGLQFIYRSLCENRGQTAADYSPADISHRAQAGDATNCIDRKST